VQRLRLPGSPTEIVIGVGAAELLGEEAVRHGARRAVIVCSPRGREVAETVGAPLVGERTAAVLAIAQEQVPAELAARAIERCRHLGADALVAIGGGSVVGLAKAVALDTRVPIFAVPTTYSGSEMTPIWGLTESGAKRTGRDERVRSRVVLYDPLLSAQLPPKVAVPSAFNALAHAVEAAYAANLPDDIARLAEESTRLLAGCLPGLAAGTNDLGLREAALRGACLAGACLAESSMGLHHKLCHVLSGTFGLPHAETHAALLPFVARYNLQASASGRALLSRALEASDPSEALSRLAAACKLKPGLGRLGLPRDAIGRVADLALEAPYPNPRSVTATDLRVLLEEAY
jgi:maleylacetate reductase